ncbi:MAG: hypothetical protein Q8P65_01165 [bacterium]|nr:hypothetical protein [bacterium]
MIIKLNSNKLIIMVSFYLTKGQIEKISDIASDIGIVALASVIIPSVLDKFNFFIIILGIFITLTSWIFSVRLRK